MKDTLKKILIFGLLIFGLGFSTISPVFADGDRPWYDESMANCDYFLGMPSWDCHLDTEKINSTEGLKEGIWMIIANISISITILAAYLALGFIVYGGYRYIFAGGDTGKVASGRKTLTTAFVGLGIVILANIIFNGIKFALLTAGGSNSSSPFGLPDVEANTVFTNALSWIIGMAGFAAAIFLVYGGISYITSSGDAGKLTKAKNTILYALIGLVIVGLAEIILAFVSSTIRKSAESAQINNQTIAIIEEDYEK